MVAINGFVVSADRAAIGIKTFRVPGTVVDLPVRAEVAPLLIGLAKEFHESVEPLRKGECWGYAFRAVRGGSTPSFHAAGIAVDLNAPSHPLGARGTFSGGQAALCRALARKYGCRWGGDYTRRADEMHFEVIVGRAQALGLVQRLQQRPGKAPKRRAKAHEPSAAPAPAGVPEWPGVVFKQPPVMRHEGVREWQQRMRDRGWKKMEVDGVYGKQSDAICRQFQAEKGLAVDGKVGLQTWAAAWSAPIT